MNKKMISLLFCATFLLSACEKTNYIHVGPNWAAVNNLKASDKTFDVNLNVGQEYTLGDEIELSVKTRKAGRLWVVQVDSNDELSYLFPSEYESNNNVTANQVINIPSVEGIHITAAEPVGESVIVAIVLVGDTEINDVLRDKNGLEKALILIQDDPEWGIDTQVVNVKKVVE
jgi:hypothetical protein